MYVIKTNDLHQRINNGVNYKTHGTHTTFLSNKLLSKAKRRFYVPLLRLNIKTHQQTELLGAKFAH